MNFIDVLRNARTSRAAVLHEFLAQYDPAQRRVHAFFEGHDDVAFFSKAIERVAPPGFRILAYKCEGKKNVFEAFAAIMQRLPSAKYVLFFVDKDLDDVLGIPWPTDPRIFVTDVYSVENYMVDASALRRLYRSSVRLVGVSFEEEAICSQFEQQWARFWRVMLPVMAWIVFTKRRGGRPNLNNIDLKEICEVSTSCDIASRWGARLDNLRRMTGISDSSAVLSRLLPVARELGRIPAKRVLRGKFEAWFFVEFWKSLVKQLQQLAKESGGSVTIKIPLEHSTFVTVMAGHVEVPRSLDLFLSAHFPRRDPELEHVSSRLGRNSRIQNWWSKVRDLLSEKKPASTR
jgi:hypothetical protein